MEIELKKVFFFVYNMWEQAVKSGYTVYTHWSYTINTINMELTSTFLLYRGLVHPHHRVFKSYTITGLPTKDEIVKMI